MTLTSYAPLHKQLTARFSPVPSCLCFPVVSLEGRAVHLATLVQEAEQRVSELRVQVGGEAPGEREGSDRDRQLKAWEWRLRLFRRMQTGFEHASKALNNFDASLNSIFFHSSSQFRC